MNPLSQSALESQYEKPPSFTEANFETLFETLRKKSSWLEYF